MRSEVAFVVAGAYVHQASVNLHHKARVFNGQGWFCFIHFMLVGHVLAINLIGVAVVRMMSRNCPKNHGILTFRQALIEKVC